ncbi:MAG TPA: hypothetical protein VGK31_03050 [Thermoanaerobaculia bacterium]|jgi:hypothetical protein
MTRFAFLFSALALLTGCGAIAPLANVAEAARDDDNDRWFTHPNNQRVTLKLDQVNLPAGRYFVVADGVRQPFSDGLDGTFNAPDQQPFTVDLTLTSRAIGNWLLDQPDQLVRFSTPVEVVRETGQRFSTNVEWTNREGLKEVVLGNEDPARQWFARFKVTVERFADPNPNDATGDTDADGIAEDEEADLAQHGGPIGDPGRRDLVMIVVNTHPDWGITSLSRDLLRSRFRQHGINLYIAFEEGESIVNARPGRDTAVARDWRPALVDAPSVRDRHIFGLARNYAQLLILAIRPALDDADYGVSELHVHPSHNLICRSHLWQPIIGPDFREYQAKCIMHELGHNLGLCHPSESTSSCPTGSIPDSERNSGTTVMGAPAEDRGNLIDEARNAWNRPLDYSPTQWSNANLERVRQ